MTGRKANILRKSLEAGKGREGVKELKTGDNGPRKKLMSTAAISLLDQNLDWRHYITKHSTKSKVMEPSLSRDCLSNAHSGCDLSWLHLDMT